MRKSQLKDETAADYVMRVGGNLKHEYGSVLDELKTVEAVFDFFDLWTVYDTDLWEGVLDSVADGEDPSPAIEFCKKHGCAGLLAQIESAVEEYGFDGAAK